MLGILFLISILLGGLRLAKTFDIKSRSVNLITAFTTGSLLCVSAIYFVTSYLTKDLTITLLGYFIFSAILVLIKLEEVKKSLISIKSIGLKTLTMGFLIFSSVYYFLNKSFSYSQENFLISSNTFLDSGAHIPFIRSFSLGNNFPAEVPFFGNSHLIYHFMFDFYVGVLEFLGLNISISVNILSAIFFSFLLIMIYELGKLVFKNRSVGFLSAVFFLFTPSLSFISFFSEKGINLSSVWHSSVFLLNSPFGDNTVSVFWTLNTFTNQRHLIFGILFVLLVVYLVISKAKENISLSKIFSLGLLVGLFPFWNTQVYLSIIILTIMFILLIPKIRTHLVFLLFLSVGIALPQLFLIMTNSENSLVFNPGFMVSANLTLFSFAKYWLANLGIAIALFFIGIWKAKGNRRLILILFLPLFIIPNIFQFGRDIFDNHKFFNLWIISFYFYVSIAMSMFWNKGKYAKIGTLILLSILILPGFLNLLVIKNDVVSQIPDYSKNEITEFIKNKIPNDKLILTNGEIYDPASIMGKKTYLGRSHYVYLYGGDPEDRIKNSQTMLLGENGKLQHELFKQENISYIIIYKDGFAKNLRPADRKLFNAFELIYEDDKGSIFKI